MDNANETGGAVRLIGQDSSKNWGALDALRRNFRSDTKSDESSPLLLGSGSGSSSEDGRSAESKNSGAVYAFRRNFRSDAKSDESSPLLLGSGSGSSSEDGRSAEVEWSGYADYKGLSRWRTPTMYWLLPPFFLFAMAFGGIMVPKLNMILSLVCREYYIDQASRNPNYVLPSLIGDEADACRYAPVQTLAAKFMLYTTLISGSLSAIMSPKLGSLSDRYGRLKILVFASLGGLLGEVMLIIAATFPATFNYRWLLLGAVFEGLGGSFIAGMALTHAYATDCTSPPERAVAFGYFHACLFSGIAAGPLFAAALIKVTGSNVVPFYFAVAIHAFFITFILGVAPESLTQKRQMESRKKYELETQNLIAAGHSKYFVSFTRSANILGSLKVLYPTGSGSSRHLRTNLILLATVDTIIFGVAMGAMAVLVLYVGAQFGWKTPEISVFTSIVNSTRVLTLVVVLPLLNYLIRVRPANKQRRESGIALAQPNSGSDNLDLYIVRAAVFFEIIGFAGYSIVRTGPLFLLSAIITSFGGVASPTLQSALTKHVPNDQVGALLGATGLLHALGRIVAPLVFNLIYAATVATFPQAVFVVLAGCFVLAFLCSWFIRPHVYLEDPVTTTGMTVTNADPDVLVDEEIVAM